MKIVDNVEFSHVKEVVISHKVFYEKCEDGSYARDDAKSYGKSIENGVMPETMGEKEMADYVREYVGRNKWKIVYSTNTINIFKKGSKQPEEKASDKKSKKMEPEAKKSKRS